LCVDQESFWHQRGVEVAQDVHDVLDRDASQRPAAERDVETLTWDFERFCAMHREADAAELLIGERRARGRDVLEARIEGVHRRRARGREHRETAFSAADVEDTHAVETDEVGDRCRLHPSFVASLHRLRLRLERLRRRAARAELERLGARVFELRAGVGVDELPDLDPLEAMAF
jgi:hypothetical protein